MAVQWTTKSNCTQEWRFLPSDIVIPEALNGRHVLPDIEGLIQDILVNGQHTPVVIRKDGGKPVLCAGFSRYRAVSEINKRKLLPVPLQLRCTYSQSDEKEGFLLAVSENHHRNSLTDLDYAYQIKMLMKKFAMTEEQVALIYFPGASDDKLKAAKRFVKQRLALINLSKSAEKAMLEGTLKGSAARAIAKLSAEQQQEALAERQTAPLRKPSLRIQIASVVDSGKIPLPDDPTGGTLPEWVLGWLKSLLTR